MEKNMNKNSMQTGIWLIGLGILWMFDLWWPGILILIGTSMMVRALVPEPDQPPKPVQSPTAPAEDPETEEKLAEAARFEDPLPPVVIPTMPVELLPNICPACGGPVKENAHKVEWHNRSEAVCPFCAFNLKIE
jgi:hypothetical protein